ncbi:MULTISPECIES: fimbria/pilus outer membrane usher protein [Cupriavidus]
MDASAEEAGQLAVTRRPSVALAALSSGAAPQMPAGGMPPRAPASRQEPGRQEPAEPLVVAFNSALFAGKGVDLSRYARGNPVEPGTYPVDVSVNGAGRGRLEVEFRAVPGSETAAPCFTLAALERLGVDSQAVVRKLKGLDDEDADATIDAARATLDPDACLPLREALPGASASFDSADLKLDLTIPQLAMSKTPQGYIDPARWDNGINAGMLQYSLNTYTSEQKTGEQDFRSAYLGLQTGVNIGAWRVRQRSTVSWLSRGSGMGWRSLEAYAQRDITALRSQLTAGDSYTSGEVFDSFGVRGVQLASDDRMLPDSLRSYAPVIRGVADTNARVVVRQNGNILYEASVPPGPFEFSDLPATGYGGDLVVTVIEADGRERQFSVPFASVTQLLRPGSHRFSVAAGRYRDAVHGATPWVAQATYQRGLTNLVTAYGGVLASAGYASGVIGVGLNTPIGAIALDATAARTELPGHGNRSGVSMRASYSKMMPDTRTNFSLAAYRYSTPGFYSLSDAVRARDDRAGAGSSGDYRARSRLQVNVNQQVGTRSAFYVSGSAQDYWGTARGRDLQFQFGFSSVFRRVGYSLYAQRATNGNGRTVTQIGLNLSIPLGQATAANRNTFSFLSASASRDSAGNSALQSSLSGSRTDIGLDYGVNMSRIVSGDNTSASLGGYGTYRSPVGTVTANASLNNRMRQASLGATGAVIVHRGGVTLSPPLGTAAALIEAKGAKGGRVINGQGAAIDRFGYAVIPSLTPYRANTVALDPAAVPDDVELGNTSEEVVPRLNAVVLVKMATRQGRPLIAMVRKADGSPLPMGAELFDTAGKSLGGIGQGGMTFVRGLEGSGTLTAKWGASASESCTVPYAIPPADLQARKGATTLRVQWRCRPSV